MKRYWLSTFLVCCFVATAGVVTARSPLSPQRRSGAKAIRPTPEAIWKEIKSVAESEVQSNSPLIIAPKFTVKRIGSSRQLTIVKGDVVDLGFKDDPYELPLKKQILIEALRRALGESVSPNDQVVAAREASSQVETMSFTRNVGKPFLARAEDQVKKMVVDIESTSDKDLLRRKLGDDEQRIDNILFNEIYGALETEAQQSHYNIIYGRGGDNIKKFSVPITTMPDGAKVSLMPYTLYRINLIKKTDPSIWPWTEIVQNPVDLLGGYYYRAVWRDGKRAEGRINVDTAAPIKLQPN